MGKQILMSDPLNKHPHILFLFSDTGGGHRSAAEAIIEALQLEFADRINTEMVDILEDYAPRPLNQIPRWYPYMARVPRLYGWGFYMSDTHRRSRLILNAFWPYVRQAARRFVRQHPSDLIVSLHPVANPAVLRALGENRPPFIIVVTELVTAHAAWFHRRADLCIVPTEAAYQRALKWDLRPEQVRVVGLPVADRFCQPPGDRSALRRRLGWPQDRPVILLVGGSEGMGPLEQTALTITEAGFQAALVVVAGRNQGLKERLEAQSWPIPTFIYGFVHEMPDFMGAADILVTKAGAFTISEALNAGLPMVIYSRVPGQEDGNITHVVSGGTGVWAPYPDQIVQALQNWISHPDQLAQVSAACLRQARPQAARQIARILAQYVGIEVVQ
jgi:1,2-diacylglycerol 3-beta-galactosyltransferase